MSTLPMAMNDDETAEKKEERKVEHVDVNPWDEHWLPKTLYKDIQYRLRFENKNEFYNNYLFFELEELMNAQCGEEGKDWFLVYEFNEGADFGIDLYCQNTGWMILTKLVNPDHEALPKILRIEKRNR